MNPPDVLEIATAEDTRPYLGAPEVTVVEFPPVECFAIDGKIVFLQPVVAVPTKDPDQKLAHQEATADCGCSFSRSCAVPTSKESESLVKDVEWHGVLCDLHRRRFLGRSDKPDLSTVPTEELEQEIRRRKDQGP